MFCLNEEEAKDLSDAVVKLFRDKGFSDVNFVMGVSFTAMRKNAGGSAFPQSNCLMTLMNHSCATAAAFLLGAQADDIEQGIKNGSLHVHGLPEMPRNAAACN
jgi:hypothetical protein